MGGCGDSPLIKTQSRCPGFLEDFGHVLHKEDGLGDVVGTGVSGEQGSE